MSSFESRATAKHAFGTDWQRSNFVLPHLEQAMESNNNNPYVIAQYIVYLSLSLSATWAVGRTLYKNGAAFLVDTFKGKDGLAESVNHLLVVGFYLINCGWVLRTINSSRSVDNVQGVIENVASQLGSVLLILGVMHFFNLYLFNRIRAKSDRRLNELPPLRAQAFIHAEPVKG